MNIERPDFKRICLMHIQALTNFPYIENDFDAITDYELICKVVDYLNQVIANTNDQNTAITDLYNAFIELKDYVDNYFDNNFPELVNDKLDEMAEDGTLENLLNNRLKLITTYHTFSDVVEDKASLVNGLIIKTLGYYSINDGGDATYYITNTASETDYQEDFDNGLYATLIAEYPLNVKKYGAAGDNTHDDTQIIQTVFNIAIENGSDIYFPSGTYKITEPITVNWGLGETPTRPKIQKIYGSGSQTFESQYDSTVLMGYNIPANRGIIELIGDGNTWGPNTIIEDISIYQDETTCNTNSFCLFYGDSHQFELNKVKLYGYNNLLVRCGSNPSTEGHGYASVNTRYINCAFKIFNSYSKGFSILPERIITGSGGPFDNMLIESCIFEGTAVIDCVLFNLISSHIALRMAIKDKTTTNIGLLNGHEVDYSTGFLLTSFMTCNFKSLYCEDYKRAIDVLPLRGPCGNLIVDSCYFNALSNQFDNNDNRLISDYAIITRANTSQSTWKMENLIISNCVFRQMYPSQKFIYAVENNLSKNLETINNFNYPSNNELNINQIPYNGFYIKPNYYNKISETYNVNATNLQRGRNYFKFDNNNDYIKALSNLYLTGVELYFDTAVPDDEDFALIVLTNNTTQVVSCEKNNMSYTADKKVFMTNQLFHAVSPINAGDEIQFYLYSNTFTELAGKSVVAKITLNN